MASISNDPGGKRRILFFDPNGERKQIRLGKASKWTAERIKTRLVKLVEHLQLGGTMEPDLVQWVKDLKPTLAKKLARVGLIPSQEPKEATMLAAFLKSYIDGRADLKPATKVVRGQVIRDLNEFFGETRDVRTITPGDADDFKQSRVKRNLAPTTIHKRLQNARSFFHALQRRKLIDENPFEGVKTAATGIKDRQRFVTQEEIDLVISFCPDHHWKAIVALARYGGLRCPSEVLSLRWQDIDWNSGRIIVTSPKTEHHAGKASRTIPLFPELRPFLDKAFELAPEGAVYVVDERFRKAANGPAGWMSTNLRTTFQKIIKRSGLTPWPRLLQNLRASRETELIKKHTLPTVTEWLGNTPKIAMRHYLMSTKEEFEAAVRGDQVDQESGPERKVTQKTAQQAHAGSTSGSHEQSSANKKPRNLPGKASRSDLLQLPGLAGTGFEPATSRL
jgi:integrase